MTQPCFLVTGGASGIGAAIATRLVNDGATVVIADRVPAGIANTRSVICDVSSEAEVQRLIAGIAETSSFLLARAAADLLRAAKGSIITVASTRAHMSEPDTESYSASKGGLLALTHALAISLGPDIRVNCISPGWINSRNDPLSAADHAQHPAGRVGKVEDIAALAAFLLRPEAGFITGSEFIVDGGMTRKMIYSE